MALPSCRRSPHCISCCADPACILVPPSGPEREDEEEEGRSGDGRKIGDLIIPRALSEGRWMDGWMCPRRPARLRGKGII